MFLAGDVGATKILLEVGELRSGRWRTLVSRRYENHDRIDFVETLRGFLAESELTGKPIAAAAFGVAGPAIGNTVQMTHRPWAVDGDLISDQLDIPKVDVVNDLAAAAHGIDWLGDEDLIQIQPGVIDPEAPRVVIGVGTGLGISYVIRAGDHTHEVPGEGGHENFAPATLQQMGLWQHIFATHGRVSNEDVLSGKGLEHVYAFTSGDALAAEEISAGALARNDPKCVAALDLFVECLGSIAGDHALAVLARGGVYLTGGVVAKIAPALSGEKLRKAFSAKGAHAEILRRIPVIAVRNERAVLLGAARYAGEKTL